MKDCCKECGEGKVCASELKEAKKKELNKIVLKDGDKRDTKK
jgi:hypothetical protein